MALNVGYLTARKTPESDNCFTPYYAVDPIIKYLPRDKIIWCPFDEEWSAFYQTLKSQGFNVVRSSLIEGQDFFQYEPDEWDIIVSNPPFSLKDQVLERVYSFNKPFALLLPVNSIQGKKRYNYFKNGVQLLSFDKRINYHTNFDNFTRGNPFASAYFCKDVLPHDLIIEELEEYEKSLRI